MTFECELAAVGIGGIVAALAAPEVSAAAFLAAEGVVGGEVAALAGTTCGLLLGRIYKDAKTVEDPPARRQARFAVLKQLVESAPRAPGAHAALLRPRPPPTHAQRACV